MGAPEPHSFKKRRRSVFTMTAWASCALMLISAVAIEASRATPFIRRTERVGRRENVKHSNDSKEAPASVNISKFQLVLDGTFPPSLSNNDIPSHVKTFLTDYVGDEAKTQGMNLETLDLAVAAPSSRRNMQESISVEFAGGVAFFSRDPDYPEQEELDKTIQTGIEGYFPGYLEDAVPDTQVTSATYTSLSLPPTPAPPPPATPGGLQAPEQSVDQSKKRGIIAAGAVGAFLGILIVGGALLVRRQRGPSLDEYLERANAEDNIKDNATHVVSSIHDGVDDAVHKSSSGETTSTGQRDFSTQDDSSQWTLSTYPEDANTVMTYGTGKSVVTSSNQIDRTESFERDRQVSLKKDMLSTSPGWNATDAANEGMSGKRVDDTVLAPSHFVTAEEPEPSNHASTARFAANDEGEEIYLMPPSKPKVSFQEAS